MNIEEALEHLELTGKEYNLSIVRKQYRMLLRKYHPDNNIGISNEEKLLKCKQINNAYKILKTKLESEKLEDNYNTLEDDYNLESQMLSLLINSIPKDLQRKIEEYYEKYILLYKTEKIKSLNSLFSPECDLSSYKEKYERYRKELTYVFFNYLENNTQKAINGKSYLYSMIFAEYCEKYDSGIPSVLESLYAIVQKFICFYPLYLKEMIQIKENLKNELLNFINEKLEECQKQAYYSEIKDEIDNILEFTLKRIASLFDVADEEKIDTAEIRHIKLTFEDMINSIIQRYDQFLKKKDVFINSLENAINKLTDESLKSSLLLELSSIHNELNIETFFSKVSRIKETIPSNLESNDKPKMLFYLNDETSTKK